MKRTFAYILVLILSAVLLAQRSNAQENDVASSGQKKGGACATPELQRGKTDELLARGKPDAELARGAADAPLNRGKMTACWSVANKMRL
jgi:hypothetical protein